MAIPHVEGVDDYVHYIRENPIEAKLLFKELLIDVTCFFRDPEVWQHVKQDVLPARLSRFFTKVPGRDADVAGRAQVSDDMDNLLNSTDIATLFLDRLLHVRRYALKHQATLVCLRDFDLGVHGPGAGTSGVYFSALRGPCLVSSPANLSQFSMPARAAFSNESYGSSALAKRLSNSACSP